MKTRKYRYLFGFIAALTLSGCGSDNGSSGAAPARPPTSINGQGTDARISYALIEAYPFGNFKAAEKLGEVEADVNGLYKLVFAAPSQAISLRLSIGAYTEEASGVEINLNPDQYLYSATYFESGKPLVAMITPLTNKAHALAVWKVGQGMSVNNAVTESISAISGIYGFDILTTYPIDITDFVGNGVVLPLDDSAKAGFLGAALSALSYQADPANPHTLFTGIGLSQIDYLDIASDGYHDGSNSSTQMSYGLLNLTANTPRNELSYRMLEAANSPYNITGINAIDLLPYATQIASSTHEVFAGIAAQPIDSTPPIISTTNNDGAWYSDWFNYQIMVDDFIGIKSVELSVDGNRLPSVAGNLSNFSHAIDTKSLMLAFGPHTLTVIAVDFFGNSSTQDYTFNVNNDGPTVNYTSPQYINSPKTLITGVYDDLNIGIESIIINNVPATINAIDKTFSVNVPLSIGINNLNLIATDLIKNKLVIDSILYLDTAAPTLESIHSTADFLQSDGSILNSQMTNGNTNLPIYIPTKRKSLNGESPLSGQLSALGYPFFRFLITDNISAGAETPPADLLIEYSYQVAGADVLGYRNASAFTDFISSKMYLYLPIVSEVLGDSWALSNDSTIIHTLNVRVTDNAGNAIVFPVSFKNVFDLPSIISSVMPNNNTIVKTPFDISAKVDGTSVVRTCVFYGAAELCAALPKSPTFTINGLTDGPYDFTIKTTNAINDVVSTIVSYTVDNTPPTATINTISNGVTVGRDHLVELTVNDSMALAMATLSMDDVIIKTYTDFASQYTPFALVAVEGAHNMVLTATDGAGNKTVNSVAFTVDYSPPTVAFSNLTPGQYITGVSPVNVVATDTYGIASVVFYVNGALLPNTAVVVGDVYTIDMDTTLSKDGANILKTLVTDFAGATSESTISINIDNSIPVILGISLNCGQMTGEYGALAPLTVTLNVDEPQGGVTITNTCVNTNGGTYCPSTPMTYTSTTLFGDFGTDSNLNPINKKYWYTSYPSLTITVTNNVGMTVTVTRNVDMSTAPQSKCSI